MQDGRWKTKHAEKKHRMVLLVQTSVQARWWGGRMREASGKTQVSSSAPTVNEHNQAYSVISQTVRKRTYYLSFQAGGVSSSTYPLENWSLCQGPTKLWQVIFPPLSHGIDNSYGTKGATKSYFLWGFLNLLPLLQHFKSHEQNASQTQSRL